MKGYKVIAICIVMGSLTVAAMAQQPAGTAAQQELSVEESYLQESVETMVIREQSRADSRDMKLIALQYIGDAIEDGRANEETVRTLEYLGLEGTVNTTREGGYGRITNNFPDVRARAAEYLGEVGTEEAQQILIKIMLAEPEPMVLTEAVKALGKIGLNDNEETVQVIAWIVTRFDVLNPDNMLALAALDAFEQIATKNGGIKDPSTVRAIMRIAEGSYIRPVQARALRLLYDITHKKGASSSGSGQQR